MTSFKQNSSALIDITNHLIRIDKQFSPPLSTQIDINAYGKKLFQYASHAECWHGTDLIGLLSYYANSEDKERAFITHVGVEKRFTGKGIGYELLNTCIRDCHHKGYQSVSLEVFAQNAQAIKLYEKAGFEFDCQFNEKLKYTLIIQ